MQKIVKFSRKNDLVKIGESEERSRWYYLTEAVQTFISSRGIQVGDDVSFDAVDTEGEKTQTITGIRTAGGASTASTGGSAPAPTSAPAPARRGGWTPRGGTGGSSYNGNGSTGKSYGRSPQEQDSIKRQAIGNMTSRAMIALSGSVDQNSIFDVATALYKHFSDLVDGKVS